jgi:hypothetical protein
MAEKTQQTRRRGEGEGTVDTPDREPVGAVTVDVGGDEGQPRAAVGDPIVKANPLDHGVAMIEGRTDEPQGPEDAFGPGAKRGQYEVRAIQDGSLHYENRYVGTTVAVTSGTAATPVVLTVPSGHGALAEDVVELSGYSVAAVNGVYTLSAAAATTVTLRGSSAAATGTGGILRIVTRRQDQNANADVTPADVGAGKKGGVTT